jgi:hypothetical protein
MKAANASRSRVYRCDFRGCTKSFVARDPLGPDTPTPAGWISRRVCLGPDPARWPVKVTCWEHAPDWIRNWNPPGAEGTA